MELGWANICVYWRLHSHWSVGLAWQILYVCYACVFSSLAPGHDLHASNAAPPTRQLVRCRWQVNCDRSFFDKLSGSSAVASLFIQRKVTFHGRMLHVNPWKQILKSVVTEVTINHYAQKAELCVILTFQCRHSSQFRPNAGHQIEQQVSGTLNRIESL